MCRETPRHTAVVKIQRCPVVLNTSEINPGPYSNDVSRRAGGSILPLNRAGVLVERVNVTDSTWRAALVGANQNQVTGEQRIAVKALLIAIFLDVVTPPDRATCLIQCVERPGAGPDVNQVVRDRGYRKDSTASVKLPDLLR